MNSRSEWVAIAAIDFVERFALMSGILLGLAGVWQYHKWRDAWWVGAWFADNPGWEVDLFSAFSALGGFMLTAIALAITLGATPEGKARIDSRSGRGMLRHGMRSVWLLLLLAASALLHVPAPGGMTVGLVVFLAPVAAAQSLCALAAITAFFTLWSSDQAVRT